MLSNSTECRSLPVGDPRRRRKESGENREIPHASEERDDFGVEGDEGGDLASREEGVDDGNEIHQSRSDLNRHDVSKWC